ncbi:MAG: RDD family protein [Pseudomonadota bacterium]
MAWFGKRKTSSDKALARAAKRIKKRERSRLTIMPPEGVPLILEPASLGGRLGAQFLDLLFTMLAAFAIIWAALYAFQGLRASSGIVIVLTFFFLRIPYYIVSEIVWNGQTPAKRILGLRTISVNGKGLTIYQIVVRNLLREIEFFSPITYLLAGAAGPTLLTGIAAVWTLIVIIVPIRNRWNQRLGDILADTAVIESPRPTLLPDVAFQSAAVPADADPRSVDDPFERWKSSPLREKETASANRAYAFSREQLDYYGRHELQVLEKVLRTGGKTSVPGGGKLNKDRRSNLVRIARQIGQKIGYKELITKREAMDFLTAFYRAQRAYLEERNLMGDRRDDKNYR